ncbi:MAG: CRISPR-associated helicase Cas3' [Lysobacterales bacterium]
MSYTDFFKHATRTELRPKGLDRFWYQKRLAEESWPDLLDIPTGMGKTAAVVLAWLWKRGWREGKREAEPDAGTPRRLVYCLPMRVLVEQTQSECERWLRNLGALGIAGEGKVSVHVLMGGAEDIKTWVEYPEEDMILIGTQDMLLSRALMRGYGMSRYQWPVHFSLLHNDCLWLFDEVQLMGAGLATSAQLDAFRRRFPLAKGSRTLWVSATLNRDWLDTVDFRPHLDSLATLGIGDEDRQQAGSRLDAVKSIGKLDISLTKEVGNKTGLKAHLDALSEAILREHDGSGQTLVIVNRVERAQGLFRRLHEARPNRQDLLVHARFRAAERAEQNRRLRSDAASDRIVVATQAIEAGVDISSKLLVTELAPWSSLVQRFGRCNRYGEHNAGGARILWVDIDDKADASPYTTDTLFAARSKLSGLASGGIQHLPPTDEARPLNAVLRRKDLLDLFNTDPDLSGFDVDISDYIRDSDRPGVQVYWRDFKEDPNQSGPDGKPEGNPCREELCPVSIGQVREFAKRDDTTLWRWDALDNQWVKLDRDRYPRPGMTLLLRAVDGGYDEAVGFDAGIKKPPVSVIAHSETPEQAFESDDLTQIGKWVSLPIHLSDAASKAIDLCKQLPAEANLANAVVRAARWHDLGKAHEAFQCALKEVSAPPDTQTPWAKSDQRGRLVYRMCRHEGAPRRKFFRHELASMLGWLAQHDGEPDADLIAYLIAAHHGKVRMSLRAMPTEAAQPGVKRYARGVWEGDVLPALDFDGEHSAETTLKLALMEIGEGEQGPSWTARTLRLLDEHGPFRLAWLETLVRIADWRASREEQLDRSPEQTDNGPHELDHGHSPLAQPPTGGTAPYPPRAPAAQGDAQHGVRRGAGGSADAGAGTRPPHAATRHLETTLGVLSYTEPAPHLARRVEALQNAIDEGEFDNHNIDESLLLEFHRRICAELTPGLAGRWRTTDVVVGTHQPPPHFQVAQHMREYAADLKARLQSLPIEPNDLWLETLAFAEGRLLSIHPFADFNGRVTRVFADVLTRSLKLPDVDPTPDAGVNTERYLQALRAADRNHWQPLMTIWRERFEKGVDA